MDVNVLPVTLSSYGVATGMPDHSNPHFVTRGACPCCGRPGGTTLLDIAFCESPIVEYLNAFYEPQGGVEFDWLEGARFTLVECMACGMIYQQHIAGDALMTRLYDRWIDPQKVFELYDGCHGPSYFMELSSQIANVLDLLGRNPREVSCLDFGMGWGHWCQAARGFGCEVWGAELSDTRIAFAEANGLRVLAWDDIPKQQFDLINTEQVFEHLPEPYETLLHLQKALKPGGLIRISVPDGWDIKRRLAAADWQARKGSRNSLNAVAPLEHINCFNRRVICQLATRAGLTQREVPERFATSLLDGVKRSVRTRAYRSLGRGASLYFAKQ